MILFFYSLFYDDLSFLGNNSKLDAFNIQE